MEMALESIAQVSACSQGRHNIDCLSVDDLWALDTHHSPTFCHIFTLWLMEGSGVVLLRRPSARMARGLETTV